MSLRVRAEVELGLFDQQHEASQVGREQALHPHHELEPAVRFRPMVRRDWRLQELGDVYGDVLSDHHRLLREAWPRLPPGNLDFGGGGK